MKTDMINTESRSYVSPTLEYVKLDNEISLILNSFDFLPGDPNPNCVTEGGDNQFAESPWEQNIFNYNKKPDTVFN